MALGPLMIGVPGLRLDAADRELLAHPAVGGAILFDRNFEDPGQLASLCADIHAVREPRLLIAVDQEGGRVQRFRGPFSRLPAAACFGSLYDDDPKAARRLARDAGWLMATELRACGVDFSFAPALDLHTRESVVIGNRALHRRPEVVAELARAVMNGMGEAGMRAVGKHFPGHGSVAGDSHLMLPVDERDLETLRNADMLVFERLIHYGLQAVLAAHVVYPRVDARPAGYSTRWLKDILRGELRFSGAVFSDDLGMAGAALEGGAPAQVTAALGAGCDMVLLCNDRAAVVAVIDAGPLPGSALRSARLAPLHGRRAGTWRDIEGDPRRHEVAAALAALEPAPELDLGDEAPI